MELQGTQKSQNILERRTKEGFKTYYKATVVKTLWYWQEDRYIDQWNRTEGPERNPYPYGRVIFDSTRRPSNGERVVFQQMVWDNWITTRERIKLDPYLTKYSKIISKCIKDLNGRDETIKHFGKKHRVNLNDLGFGKGFLGMTPKA